MTASSLRAIPSPTWGAKRTNGPSEGPFDRVGFGFVRMIENMLSVWYPEQNFRITNAGVAGNTSRHLLARFETDGCDAHGKRNSACLRL